MPNPEPLPKMSRSGMGFDQIDAPVPDCLVADDVFRLSINCMTPYPQMKLTDRKRIFNCRLSRVRRISQNAVGIWSTRFRVFTTSMTLAPDIAKDNTMATVVHHNMLRTKSQDSYTPEGSIDQGNSSRVVKLGDWRNENISSTNSLPKTRSNRASNSAVKICNILAGHFYGPGPIPQQSKILF